VAGAERRPEKQQETGVTERRISSLLGYRSWGETNALAVERY
jgi:hypothetical protein